jgi:hypothetical protein
VHKFLDPPLNGLDVLVEYLQSTLNFMKESEKYTTNGSNGIDTIAYDPNVYTGLGNGQSASNTSANSNGTTQSGTLSNTTSGHTAATVHANKSN